MKTSRGLVVALVLLRLLTTGTGAYLMVLRPPLLPEDIRFTGRAGACGTAGLLLVGRGGNAQ